MSLKAICCTLVIGGIVTTADAQEIRSFPEDHCTYKLPDNSWKWEDPKTTKGTDGAHFIRAKSESGLLFNLRIVPRASGQENDRESAERLASTLVQDGRYANAGLRQLTFKGAPCYQLDIRTKDGKEGYARIIPANAKVYILVAVNPLGKLSPEESETIFQGFNLLDQPKPQSPTQSSTTQKPQSPTQSSDTQKAFQQDQKSTVFVYYCFGVLVLGGVVILTLYLIMRNRRVNESKRRRLHESKRRRKSRQDEDDGDE